MSVDIMNVPLRLFDKDMYSFAAMMDSDNISQMVKIGLLTKFYKNVIGDEVDFSGIYNNSMEKANERMLKILMSSMEKWSSFRIETIYTKYLFLQLGVEMDEYMDWEEGFQILYLQNNLRHILSEMQYTLFMQMPMAVVDSLNWSYPWKAIYIYSRRLSVYLNFAKENAHLISNQFKEEHKRILEALQVMKDLVCPSWIPTRSVHAQFVSLSVGLGVDGEYGVTENDWNYNFFIAAYVLERLLDLASDYFHFDEEEEDDV